MSPRIALHTNTQILTQERFHTEAAVHRFSQFGKVKNKLVLIIIDYDLLTSYLSNHITTHLCVPLLWCLCHIITTFTHLSAGVPL